MILVFLPLIILGGIGLILVVTGILISVSNNKRRAACIYKTNGEVIKYCYPGGQAAAPVASYFVEGTKYTAKKRYRAVMRTTRKGRLADLKGENNSMYVDKNDIAHLKAGNFVDHKKLAAEIWPIGSQIDVYYNPEKPSQAYLERVPKKGSIAGSVLRLVGIFLIVLSAFITFMFNTFMADELRAQLKYGDEDYGYSSHNTIALDSVWNHDNRFVFCVDCDELNKQNSEVPNATNNTFLYN